MQELQELAKKLLLEGTVKVVIGYEDGPRGVRPAFVTDPAQAGTLIFDTRCVHNLATYLHKRRTNVKKLGKPAVVVKGCDAKAVAGFIRESQLKREDVVLIGVRCGGVLYDPTSKAPLTEDTVSARCPGCDLREPHLADHLVGALPPPPPGASRALQKLKELDAMSPAERWNFWQQELERCIRCHACREVCPMCFCDRCVCDKSQPQWIETSSHPRGNLAYHVTRALHQAGRCVGCGECTRVCPAGIPLGLINMKVAQVVKERFDFTVTDDPSAASPIGTFRQDDEQEFIL